MIADLCVGAHSSDLDGDEYVVIWEKCLFFSGPNRRPKYFSDRNSEPHGKPITTDGMIQFICNYIKNDSIGIFANTYLAWADKETEGIYSQKCLAIAEKISVCLDFTKNGKTAYLRRDERPMLYPGFMEKGSHKTTCRSDRALVVLCRTCRSLEAAVGRLGHRHVDPGRCQALAIPGWEEYRKSAAQALTDYNTNLRRVLNQYGIGSEGEVMACVVNTFNAYHSAQSDKLNIEDLVEKMVKFLTVTTRDVFYKGILKEMQESCIFDTEELTKRKFRRASAWYMVTYEQKEEDSFFSFPWCIADLLIEILRSAGAQDMVWCPNILYWKIDHLVEENSSLAENDGLGASCDSFKTAFQIIKKLLKEETLLGEHKPGASFKPGLCSNCLLDIHNEFVESSKFAPLSKIVTRRRHAMMMLETAASQDEPSTEPTVEASKKLSAGKCISHKKAPTEPWQIIDGFVEPLCLDVSDETVDSGLSEQGGQGEYNEQDVEEVTTSTALLLHEPWDGCDTELDHGKDPSVGTLVVSFLRWCLEQHRLPREMCRVGACAGGGYDCQTHRLSMVALRAYSSLAVSLDPCHISLPCDPAYHDSHREVFERDPVRILIANPGMEQMLKEKLNAVRYIFAIYRHLSICMSAFRMTIISTNFGLLPDSIRMPTYR
ncbi:uncharacterized protein LOC142775165 [Rhipicephalus microplus]|uniref:uncharacterized protein LOC142775165 n=1 Tax=Rhipicephalus microplus TaxID=6941 RepID=UPI003F6AD70C